MNFVLDASLTMAFNIHKEYPLHDAVDFRFGELSHQPGVRSCVLNTSVADDIHPRGEFLL